MYVQAYMYYKWTYKLVEYTVGQLYVTDDRDSVHSPLFSI